MKTIEKSKKQVSKKLGIILGAISGVLLIGTATTAIATPLAVRRYTPQEFQFANVQDSLVIQSKMDAATRQVTLSAPNPKSFFQVDSSKLFYIWYSVSSADGGEKQVYTINGQPQLGRNVVVNLTSSNQYFQVEVWYPGITSYLSPIAIVNAFIPSDTSLLNQEVADAISTKLVGASKGQIDISKDPTLSAKQVSNVTVADLQSYLANLITNTAGGFNVTVPGVNNNNPISITGSEISIASIASSTTTITVTIAYTPSTTDITGSVLPGVSTEEITFTGFASAPTTI